MPTALKSESELNFLLSASKSIKYVDAEPACLEAVQLDPDNAAAQYSLGCVLANQAKYGEAVAAFREVVRLIPAFGGRTKTLLPRSSNKRKLQVSRHRGMKRPRSLLGRLN